MAKRPDASDRPAAPGEQVQSPWLADSTRRLLRFAGAAWVLLAVLLVALQWATVGTWPGPLQLLRRMGQVAGEFWLLVVIPALALPLLAWPLSTVLAARLPERPRNSPGLFFAYGANLGLFAAIGIAVAMAGVGVVYAVDGTDPWDHMPGVTPPYLERFLAEHPALQVHKINGVYEVNLTHRETGGWLRIDGHELAGSAARFERCGAHAWSAQDFDGLPLPAGAVCRRMLHLRRPDGRERTILRFTTPDAMRFDDLRRLYEGWAKEQGLEAGFSGGSGRYDFKAEGRGRHWGLHVPDARSAGPSVLLEPGGRARPLGQAQ